ncbi:MAG: lysostaphin resistance A-like protein [Ruminiclostridium sp.]
MADKELRGKSVFEVSKTAAKDSETKDFRRLMGKYGAAMLLFFLNGSVIALLIMLALGVTGLVHREMTDFSYAMLMLSNEIVSYAFPLVFCYLLFDKEVRAVPLENNYKRFSGDNFLLFAGSIAAGAGGTILTQLISSLLNSLFGTPMPVDAFDSLSPDNISRFLVFALCICVISPICEEIIFRKYLLKPLRAYGDMAAALVSSIIFGLYHGNFDQFAYAALAGFFYALIAIRSESIIPSIVFHAANNLLMTFGVYAPENLGNDFLDMLFSEMAEICGLLMDIIMFAGIIALIVLAVKGVFKLYTRSLYLSGKDMFLKAWSPLFIVGVAVMVAELFI